MLKKMVFGVCTAILLVQPFTTFADYAEDWWNYDYTSYEEAYDDAYNKGYQDAYNEFEDELTQLEKLEKFESLQEENWQLKEENTELQDKLERASNGETFYGITTALMILAIFYLVYRLEFPR